MSVALQLRCLLRNDAALIEHLGNQLTGIDGVIDAVETADPRRARLLSNLGQAIRTAQRHQADLHSLRTPPAAAEARAPGSALSSNLPL